MAAEFGASNGVCNGSLAPLWSGAAVTGETVDNGGKGVDAGAVAAGCEPGASAVRSISVSAAKFEPIALISVVTPSTFASKPSTRAASSSF